MYSENIYHFLRLIQTRMWKRYERIVEEGINNKSQSVYEL